MQIVGQTQYAYCNAPMYMAPLLLELADATLGISGFGPLQYDLSVLVSLQAASSHAQTEDSSTHR